MFCPKCGGNVDNGQRFCPNCGQPVGEAGGYGSTPSYGGYSPMRKDTDRNIALYILLCIVTCGIYGYYLMYTIAKDMNDICAGDGQETEGIAMTILLSVVTCGVYGIYWWYKVANRLQFNAPRYGLSFQENGTTYLVWAVLGMLACGVCQYIGLHIVLKNLNALCDAYNRYNNL